MSTFIALYRGPTVAEAKLVAVSADVDLIRQITARILHERESDKDPVLSLITEGRRGALRLIQEEAERDV